MRCSTCLYELAHLSEPRCPECGRRFDGNDPDTYLPGTTRRGVGLIVPAVLPWLAWAALYTLLPGIRPAPLLLLALIFVGSPIVWMGTLIYGLLQVAKFGWPLSPWWVVAMLLAGIGLVCFFTMGYWI